MTGDQLSDSKKLKDSWIWPDEVTEFIRERVERRSLCVCAGKNPVCDVNVDLDPQHEDVQKGDMRKLDFDNEEFDTVVQDPPWKLGYYNRFKPYFEALRVCKIGGKVIYNAYWIPSTENSELIDVVVRQDGEFTNASIISVLKKTGRTKYDEARQGERNQLDLEEFTQSPQPSNKEATLK